MIDDDYCSLCEQAQENCECGPDDMCMCGQGHCCHCEEIYCTCPPSADPVPVRGYDGEIRGLV